eukprot:3207850-Amphidinium_carterae.1
MHSGRGSSAVPCSRHANATPGMFGDSRARVLLPVSSTLSRETCDAEFVANDASTDKRRIRTGASWSNG